MDYLQQAYTFAQRARDAKTDEERSTHLEMAIEMIAKVMEQRETPAAS